MPGQLGSGFLPLVGRKDGSGSVGEVATEADGECSEVVELGLEGSLTGLELSLEGSVGMGTESIGFAGGGHAHGFVAFETFGDSDVGDIVGLLTEGIPEGVGVAHGRVYSVRVGK